MIQYAQNSLTTSLKKKLIRVTITLVGDSFLDGSDTIVIERLRTRADIVFGNGAIMPSAYVTIYNIDMQAMEKLIRIRWRDINSMMNQIRIETADEGDGYETVYQGNITFANVDTEQAPDIALRIQSITAVYHSYAPARPISFRENRTLVSVIREISGRMGYELVNNAVSESLMVSDMTLNDTDMNKLRKLARDYQIDLYITFNEITISPQGQPRQSRVPVISPSSGLISYPSPTMQGIEFRCLFDRSVSFGGQVDISGSMINQCNGRWRVFGVTITLESETPDGLWFMDVKATWPEPNNVAISR